MPTYLFSLGLLPVQEWIAQARRARDLRAGSVLLWHLMAGVLDRLGRAGAGIVLPRLPEGGRFGELAAMPFWKALDERYGLPNRASGYLEAADDEAVRAALGAVEAEVVEARWSDWRDRHLQPGSRGLDPQPDELEFWREIGPYLDAYREAVGTAGDCPFSVVWAAERVESPAGGDPERLREDLLRIDRLFRSVKRSRPVRPWPVGARIGKCNQCGRREALGPAGAGETTDPAGGTFDRWRDWYAALSWLPWLQRGARIKPGERLCWVCLAKRMAGYSNREYQFPSTGDVAVRPWVQRVASEPELRDALERVKATEMARDDLGRTLHLPDDELPPAPAAGSRAADEARREYVEAKKAVDALRREVRRFNLRQHEQEERDGGAEAAAPPIPERPDRYLALLAFDGDGMGRRVQEDPIGVPDAMAGFARRAGKVLHDHGAATFYLGGDEGLAMAPAARALPLAIELESLFANTFAGCSGELRPTLSVGVCLFEHTRPVDGALGAARDALEEAKRLDGKRALGMTVLTASGSRWTVVRPFKGGAWCRISRATELIRDRRLASGWAYEALRLAAGFDEEAWSFFGDDLGPVRAELRRRFRRAVLPRPGEGATARRRRADAMWSDLGGERWWQPEPGRAPRAWPEQFHLIGFLARQEDPAAGVEGE